MRLQLSYQDLAEIFSADLPDSDRIIESVSFDTRKIINGENTLFFALKGDFRDGHEFVSNAYEKGVRTFVVTHRDSFSELNDAVFIEVEDPLAALQQLAKYHRARFSTPVIGVTGSAGKTIVKEWLGQLLGIKFNVVRSPKSYNSQLGVALSLLEMNAAADITIIEAGISHPGEMERLAQMIQPTAGILTSIGSAHSQHFVGEEHQLEEKLKLFNSANPVFVQNQIPLETDDERYIKVATNAYTELLDALPLKDEISRINGALVIACAQHFGLSDEEISKGLKHLEHVAMRMETFEGINNTTIINDAYNLDIDAFRSSLEYQLSIAKGKDRVVIIGTDENQEEIKKLLSDFEPIDYYFVNSPDEELEDVSDAVILIKGRRNFNMERYALRFRAKKHQTFVEVHLSAIRANISYFKSLVPESTKILTMVKAASYGSGIEEIGQYLELIGVDYLGVAYADEGVQLRKAGIKIPIIVMNTEESGFEDCVQYNLEPSIFNLKQLDSFIKRLIYDGKTNYPVHIKIETGMNRLGFEYDHLQELKEMLSTQPEVRIQSVFSHLADSDNASSQYPHEQTARFEKATAALADSIAYPFDRHILNSDGVLNFPEYHFDMIRLGIGMYGYTSSEEHSEHLTPAITWSSAVSQIKEVSPDDSVGYGRKGRVQNETRIAVVPVGYADGFRRSLSNGTGGVYIQDRYCPVVGNVCMDMIMVDIDELKVEAGEPVEIIGAQQTLNDLAKKMNTIPYEVLTGISKRVHRIYLED